MKFAPKAITTAQRAEIADAIASLQKAVKRAERNGAQTLKLSRELESLEDEHAALSGKKTLSRGEATSETAIIAQKTRLRTAIHHEAEAAESHRLALAQTISAAEPLFAELLGAAIVQVRAEVTTLLRPYFTATGQLAQVVSQTELEQNVVGHFRQAMGGRSCFDLPSAVRMAQSALELLQAIAADADFFSLTPAAAKTA